MGYNWDEIMMNTGRKMAATFEDNNIAFVNALIITSGTRHMMRWLYFHMVNRKRIQPIETLPLETKEQTWSFVKDVCEGKTTDRIIMKEIAMAFYAIEYFINENNSQC